MSFSGILSYIEDKVLKPIKKKREISEADKEDMCYSLQETAFAMLVEATGTIFRHIYINMYLIFRKV